MFDFRILCSLEIHKTTLSCFLQFDCLTNNVQLKNNKKLFNLKNLKTLSWEYSNKCNTRHF